MRGLGVGTVFTEVEKADLHLGLFGVVLNCLDAGGSRTGIGDRGLDVIYMALVVISAGSIFNSIFIDLFKS